MPRWDITASQVAADSFWDSKGDLAVGSGPDASVNLSVGCTDGHVLQICSCEASGLKWASAPAPTGNIDNGTSNITSGGIWSVDVDATGTDGACLSAAGTMRFGCGQDLRIFHGGTNNYITGVTGDLIIGTQASGTGIILDSEDDTLEIKYSGAAGANFGTGGLNLVTGDVFSIACTEVLSGSALASAVKINNANWCGTDLGVANGGTNLSCYAVGDVVYASGTTALSKLAKPGTPAGEVLTFAACATAPSWVAAASSGANTALSNLCSVAIADDMIITNGNGLVIGHSAQLTGATHPNNDTAEMQIIGTAGNDNQIAMITHATSAGHYSKIQFARSRNTTVGSHTIVQDGDVLGGFHWFGCDGTDFQNYGAKLVVKVDGTPGNDNMPGRMEFYTTPDGAGASTLAMKINNTGEVTVKCGASTPSVQDGLAKAWANYNTNVTTPTKCASYNVACLTDNGVGDYTINFTTSFRCATDYVMAAPMIGHNCATVYKNMMAMHHDTLGAGDVKPVGANRINVFYTKVENSGVACAFVMVDVNELDMVWFGKRAT